MGALSSKPTDFDSVPPPADSSDPSKDVAAGQQHHPSALRNRIPILKALLKILPEDFNSKPFGCDILEIAAGTGALMEVVAPAFPMLTYQPTEYVPAVAAPPDQQWSKHGKIGLRQGLDELANIDEHGCKIFPNCLPAKVLDLMYSRFPDYVHDNPGCHKLILVANTLHITPWACSVNLFHGAARALFHDGFLVVYGPFKLDGEFIGADGGAGNAKFDAKLRATNSEWGIRDVGDLVTVARGCGLELRETLDMPANNLILCFVNSDEVGQRARY